jgi:hypothetical protein
MSIQTQYCEIKTVVNGIPARRLSAQDLARLGNNTAAAVRKDRQSTQSELHDSVHNDEADSDVDDSVESIGQSERVAS